MDTIINNGKISIITILVFLIGLLVYELAKLKKNNVEISENDKKIIVHLLSLLNIELFQRDIYEQDSWYGYKKDAIYRMLDFREEARLLKNSLANKKLNKLFSDFLSTLDDFEEVASNSVYGENLVWLKNIHAGYDNDQRRETSIQMNRLAKNAYKKLEEIIFYLKRNKVLIN